MSRSFSIRNANPEEFETIGKLLVEVYFQLDGFPKQSDQPEYYNMLANIGEQVKKFCTELLVAISDNDEVGGAVVYFSDMQYYGSGGTATQEKNSSGFRLLSVVPKFRGLGIGKQLSQFCIDKAKANKNKQVIIHTTSAMQRAWKMYENLGFDRSEDLDFLQGDLDVFGFRYVFSA